MVLHNFLHWQEQIVYAHLKPHFLCFVLLLQKYAHHTQYQHCGSASDMKEKSTLFKPSLYGGRMTRKQYWVRYFTFIMIGRIICNSFIETAFDLTEFIVSVILLLLFEIFYTLPITIKRYHDAGYSGSLAVWLAVISTIMLFLAIFTSPSSAVGVCSLLMCIILGIVNLVILCKDSEIDDNKYGPSTKYPDLVKKEQ